MIRFGLAGHGREMLGGMVKACDTESGGSGRVEERPVDIYARGRTAVRATQVRWSEGGTSSLPDSPADMGCLESGTRIQIPSALWNGTV